MSSSGAADQRLRARPPSARIVSPPLAPGAPPASSLAAEWKSFAAMSAADIAAWRDLTTRALEPNVFLEPAFANPAAKYLGAPGLGALLVRDGTRLMGLVPGSIEGLAQGRPVATFVGWTHPYAPLSTPLLDRDAAKEVIDCVLAALPALPGGPGLILYRFVNEDGAVAQLCASELARKGVAVSRFGAHARAALRPAAGPHPSTSISGGRLKEMRRQRRRLGELGTLAHRCITESTEIGAAIDAYLALEARGWKGKAGGAAQSSVSTRAFLTEAVAALAREGKARIDLLALDEKPVAAAITLFSGDRAWFWKISYDEEYARFSPGVQLALDLSEDLGRDTRDSLVDSCAVAGHPMIDHLWSERLAIADWMMPLGQIGGAKFGLAVGTERICRFAVNGLRAARDLARRS